MYFSSINRVPKNIIQDIFNVLEENGAFCNNSSKSM